MKIHGLAAMLLLSTMTFAGCEKDNATAQPGGSGQSDPFDLQGDWLYLGPWSGEHTLEIREATMTYAAIDGAWSSNWTIKDYDNGLRRFQMVFESGTGTYFPTGPSLSGTYDLNAAILTVQLSSGLGAYSPLTSAGSCTDSAGTAIPDCRLYMKQ